MALRVDHEHALAGEPSAGEAFEPRAHVVGKARRAAHVEAKLDRARKFVDVLSAGAEARMKCSLSSRSAMLIEGVMRIIADLPRGR
jgi:hypothetical protein